MIKGYKKVYFDAMSYVEGDFISCEVCTKEAVDVHHIECRGMGGTTDPAKNSIFNLMALCRECHEKYGDKKQFKVMLKLKHVKVLIGKMQSILGLFREVNFIEHKNTIELIEHK